MTASVILCGIGEDAFEQLPHLYVESFSIEPMPQLACSDTASFLSCNSSQKLFQWGSSFYGEMLIQSSSRTHLQTLKHDKSLQGVDNEQIRCVHPSEKFTIRVISHKLRLSQLACGSKFVIAAVIDGGILSWGGVQSWEHAQGPCRSADCQSCSQNQQLNLRVTQGRATIGYVQGMEHKIARHVAAGDGHALVVLSDGSAWSWGLGDNGQLGIGILNNNCKGSCVPTEINIPDECTEAFFASCGRRHSALLLSKKIFRDTVSEKNSSIFQKFPTVVATFGCGLHGELGHGLIENGYVPKIISCLDGVGEMLPCGELDGIREVACGGWHTAAITATGDIYSWGWSRDGQLGVPVENLGGSEVVCNPMLVPDIDELLEDGDIAKKVLCGNRYTLTLSSKGYLLGWGKVHDQCTLGSIPQRFSWEFEQFHNIEEDRSTTKIEENLPKKHVQFNLTCKKFVLESEHSRTILLAGAGPRHISLLFHM